jgi:hypothetical protein
MIEQNKSEHRDYYLIFIYAVEAETFYPYLRWNTV